MRKSTGLKWNNVKKDLLLLGFALLFLAVVIKGTKFETKEDYYLAHLDDITEESETVFLSIRCDSVKNHWESLPEELKKGDYLPEDGMISPEAEYVLRPGDTAFTLLQRVARHDKIPLEFEGADANVYHSVYIEGIQYLYEYSCGPLSGWMYRVNNVFPGYGCSQYVLKDGDRVEFVYTCDLGRDVGGYINE